MNIKCKSCGELYDLNLNSCPKCGTANFYKQGSIDSTVNTSATINTTNLNNANNKDPKTIEELKQWYIDRRLPDESVTRFFIGKDYKGAKAFGIYKDSFTGKVIVYKNKADGSRAIRYQGPDEAYAVDEIFRKLKDEILNQKEENRRIENQYYSDSRSRRNRFNTYTPSGRSGFYKTSRVALVTILVVLYIGFQIWSLSRPKRGYYYYSNDYYYYQNGSWYGYDRSRGWYRDYNVPYDLKKNRSNYYKSSYDYDYNIDRFENSSYYVEPSTSSSSSSSSSSWDDYSWSSDDSWDSSSTDWDSDW